MRSKTGDGVRVVKRKGERTVALLHATNVIMSTHSLRMTAACN